MNGRTLSLPRCFGLVGVALVSFFAAGCQASLSTPKPEALSLTRENATFVVEGGGRVVGGMIDCGPGDDGECATRFESVGSTALVATPEKGWKFAGWSRHVANGSAAADGSSDEIVYTARFVPETVATAR
jgi:hypothetical protein